MTIKAYESSDKIVIDLGGPQGNAWVLLGLARNLSEEYELDGTEISQRMRSGNYQNLVKVFDECFGAYVDLILPAGVKSIDDLK